MFCLRIAVTSKINRETLEELLEPGKLCGQLRGLCGPCHGTMGRCGVTMNIGIVALLITGCGGSPLVFQKAERRGIGHGCRGYSGICQRGLYDKGDCGWLQFLAFHYVVRPDPVVWNHYHLTAAWNRLCAG